MFPPSRLPSHAGPPCTAVQPSVHVSASPFIVAVELDHPATESTVVVDTPDWPFVGGYVCSDHPLVAHACAASGHERRVPRRSGPHRDGVRASCCHSSTAPQLT
jgi:hypothetical protein